MNAKEAREQLDIPIGSLGFCTKKNERASGFLEAVEKFRPVVETLEEIKEEELKAKAVSAALVLADRGLEFYRRDVLGEDVE